ncbi:hypothetical protein D3C73_1031240 [compost metagenome]
MKLSANSRFWADEIGRIQPRCACSASTILSATDRSPTMPSVLRSSGQKPKRLAIAASGEVMDTSLPSIVAVPLSARSMPKSRKAVSLRPEPSRPAMPTTSPGLISRSKGATLPFLP